MKLTTSNPAFGVTKYELEISFDETCKAGLDDGGLDGLPQRFVGEKFAEMITVRIPALCRIEQ